MFLDSVLRESNRIGKRVAVRGPGGEPGKGDPKDLLMSEPVIQNDALSASERYQEHMSKKGFNFPQLWAKRYFVLNDRILKYYKTKKDYESGKEPRGALNFQ